MVVVVILGTSLGPSLRVDEFIRPRLGLVNTLAEK